MHFYPVLYRKVHCGGLRGCGSTFFAIGIAGTIGVVLTFGPASALVHIICIPITGTVPP